MSNAKRIAIAGMWSMFGGGMNSPPKVKPRGRFHGQSEEAKTQAIESAQEKRERRNSNRKLNHRVAKLRNPIINRSKGGPSGVKS